MLDRQRGEQHVDLATGQRPRLFIGNALADMKPQLGMRRVQARHDLGHQVRPEGRGNAEAYGSGQQALGASCKKLDLRNVAQDGARPGRDLAPHRGHRHGLPALDQRHAKRGFELAQLLAQRGLRDVEAMRGAAEMPLVLHCDEIPELLDR